MESIDKFDLAILQELQADGRLTNAELAQRVGLSAAPCWRRVRALEEAGFIKGYHAEIDRHKIGLGVLAFVRVDTERVQGELRLPPEAGRLRARLHALEAVRGEAHDDDHAGGWTLQVDLALADAARLAAQADGAPLRALLPAGTPL